MVLILSRCLVQFELNEHPRSFLRPDASQYRHHVVLDVPKQIFGWPKKNAPLRKTPRHEGRMLAWSYPVYQ